MRGAFYCVVCPGSRQVLSAAEEQGHWLLAPLRSWAQFGIGWTFHRGAYRALRRGRANMDVLVSVGTNAGRVARARMAKLLNTCCQCCLLATTLPTSCPARLHCCPTLQLPNSPLEPCLSSTPPRPAAAYIYSIISIIYSRVQAEFESHGLFFETSSLLITFVCLCVLAALLGNAPLWQPLPLPKLRQPAAAAGQGCAAGVSHQQVANLRWRAAGKYLEAAAKGRTCSAISALLRLAPATAILCHLDEQVKACSWFIIRPTYWFH